MNKFHIEDSNKVMHTYESNDLPVDELQIIAKFMFVEYWHILPLRSVYIRLHDFHTTALISELSAEIYLKTNDFLNFSVIELANLSWSGVQDFLKSDSSKLILFSYPLREAISKS